MATNKQLLEWERTTLIELAADPRLIPAALELGLVIEFIEGPGNRAKFENAADRLARGEVPTTRRPGVTRLKRAGILHLISHRIAARAAAPTIKAPAEIIKTAEPDDEPAELDIDLTEPELDVTTMPPVDERDQWQSAGDGYELDETAATPPPVKAQALSASPATITEQLVHAATGKTALLRSGKRKADLSGVYYYAHDYRKRFRHSDLFIAWLRKALGDRDPRDRELVGPDELGKLLDLTFTVILEIEDRKTRYQDEQDRLKGRQPPRKPFKVTTILACDMTRAQVTTERRKIRERAIEQTTTETTMHTHTDMQTTGRNVTHAAATAAQVARTRDQMDVLYDAFGDNERTPMDFMAMPTVRHHPAWSGITPDKKLYQTVCTRLDMMEAEHRIKTLRRDPGPRGSRVRVMRRI